MEAKAKETTDQAAKKHEEAARVLAEAQRARQDNAEQAAIAKKQIRKLQEAEQKAAADAATARQQTLAAERARGVAEEQQRRARREIAALRRELPACAKRALDRSHASAKAASEAAVPQLLSVFRSNGQSTCTEAGVRATMRFFANAAALHMNIDPFKDINGEPLLKLYCNDPDGRYKTLFETGTGGGCENLDARRSWERRMFGDAYDGHDKERPKYGNVNFLAHIQGDMQAVQYGGSYMLLKQDIRKRCTITSCDSSFSGARLGTLQHCAHVLLHKIESCPIRNRCDLVEVLVQLTNATDPAAMSAIGSKIKSLRAAGLDYIELQIHGEVLFEKDVAMAVVDKHATRGDGHTRRLRLVPQEQQRLWARFTQRFHVQAFQMSGSAMVPLG